MSQGKETEINKTPIDWVKNPDGTQGYTWNPITGCLNGCSYCYARKLANGRLRSRYIANKNVMPVYAEGMVPYNTANLMLSLDPFYPRFWEERLHDRGLFQEKPRGIFVCDMSDLFGVGVPEEWTDRIMDQIKIHRQHRFYLLTKQPQNLPKSPSYFPDNCWVGVTATDQKMFYEACKYLVDVKASVKYISIEPMLGGVFFPVWIGLKVLDWLIIGAQTHPYKPPALKQVENVVKDAYGAVIPVFLKDNLKPAFNMVPYEENKWLWSSYGQLRQEMRDNHYCQRDKAGKSPVKIDTEIDRR